MDDIYGIRRKNLLALCERPPLSSMLKKDQAIQLDLSASLFSQVKNPDYKIGDDIARRVEERMNLEFGWMDQPHDSEMQLPGESPTSMGLASQPVRLDAATLVTASQWATAFEVAEGGAWSDIRRMEALAQVYAEIMEDGGTLSNERHRRYLHRMDLGVQRRNGGNNERGSEGAGTEAAGGGTRS